jgi:hypothetical protein
MIRVACPKCKAIIASSERSVGQQIVCGKCRQPIKISMPIARFNGAVTSRDAPKGSTLGWISLSVGAVALCVLVSVVVAKTIGGQPSRGTDQTSSLTEVSPLVPLTAVATSSAFPATQPSGQTIQEATTEAPEPPQAPPQSRDATASNTTEEAEPQDDLKSLIAKLKDRDETVRLKAAKQLGKLKAGAADAIPALTAAANQDDDDDVRSVAKQAVIKIKEAMTNSEKDTVQSLLARNLRDVRSDDKDVRSKAVAGLAKLLTSDDAAVRSKAAQGIGEAGVAGKPLLSALNDATKDSDPTVRREARKAIENVQSAAGQEARSAARDKLAPLVKDLKDKSMSVRKQALTQIGEMGADAIDASEPVLGMLTVHSPALQQAALETLEKINPTIHGPIVTLLVDQNWENRTRAISQLQALGSDAKPSVPTLLRYFAAEPQPNVRASRISTQSHRAQILTAVNAIEPENKDFGKLVLEVIATPPQTSEYNLSQSAKLKAIQIAPELAKASRLETAKLVRSLASALQYPNYQLPSIHALGELGTDAGSALPALKRLKNDSNAAIRDAATEAVKKIE